MQRSTDNFREEIDSLWDRLDQSANEAKNSYQALYQLIRTYQSWDMETQHRARKVFGQWLHSENAKKRFDALALIEKSKAKEVEQDLLDLKEKLTKESGPEASFELSRVNEILEALATQ